MTENNENIVDIDSVVDQETVTFDPIKNSDKLESNYVVDIQSASPPQTKIQDYVLKKHADNQAFLTKSWVYTTIFVITAPILSVLLSGKIGLDDLKEIWSLALTPVMAILGSIVGYYFSESKANK